MQKINITSSDEMNNKEKIANEQEIRAKKNQFSIFIFFINIISLISFSGLLLLSCLSLICLNKYHFVFTFYRYEKTKSSSIEYFPIQVSSFILYTIIIFIILTITVTYIFYIRAIVFYKNFDILNDKNRNYIIPITLNLFLFYIGELTHNKSDIFHIYYFIGFGGSIISLFYMIKLYYEYENENDVINFNSYLTNTIIYDFFYGALIALDLYYLFYVACQIIFYFMGSIDIKIYLGIIVNLFMGIVAIYVSYKLKNMVISLLFEFIYNGIVIFHFSFTENERKNINLNSFEIVFSVLFILGFLVELIYIFFYKRNKNYYY